MEASAAAATAVGSLCHPRDGCSVRCGALEVRRKGLPGFVSFLPRSGLSRLGLAKHCQPSTFSKGRQWCLELGNRRSMAVRASSSSSGSVESSSSSSLAPLQLESPIGQFLLQILSSHPHLLPAAVERQLQQLKIDQDAENNKDESSAPTTNLVLYKRIAEVKANERKQALEEILYALVVQKFMDADVSLVPPISQLSSQSSRIDHWLHGEDKLRNLHSLDAYEMIKNHLQMILGPRLNDSNLVAPISKLKVGQVYAASVMYGYFLKRVDQRFQLEKNMKTLPWGSDEDEETAIKRAMPDESRPTTNALRIKTSSWASSDSISSDNSGFGVKSSPLRVYVSSFDGDTVQRYATVRSKEAFSIIEKHTEALFGRPEIVITQNTIDSSKDELIKISFAGLRRLILEAVTFGSFLWEVEGYVDSRYHFVTN